METPYDKTIESLKKAEANRGLGSAEDSQLQRLQHKREGWADRDAVDRTSIIKEFCAGVKAKWHDDSMGWSTGAISEIVDVLGMGN